MTILTVQPVPVEILWFFHRRFRHAGMFYKFGKEIRRSTFCHTDKVGIRQTPHAVWLKNFRLLCESFIPVRYHVFEVIRTCVIRLSSTYIHVVAVTFIYLRPFSRKSRFSNRYFYILLDLFWDPAV